MTLFASLVAISLLLYLLLILNRQNMYNYLSYIKKPNQKIDIIYVFCGSLDEYLWRVDAAAEAFKRFSANEIILSDDGNLGPWVPELDRNLTFVERAQRRLIQKGIPNDDIVILRAKIAETWGEAKALANFIEPHPAKTLLIITSPYHLRRAYWSVTHNLNERLQVYTYSPKMNPNDKQLSFGNLFIEYVKMLIYQLFFR